MKIFAHEPANSPIMKLALAQQTSAGKEVYRFGEAQINRMLKEHEAGFQSLDRIHYRRTNS